MANLSTVFVQGPHYLPMSTSERKGFKIVYPDISAAKGQSEGHLQWRAINRFYIGSFFTRLSFRMLYPRLPGSDIYRAAREEAQSASKAKSWGEILWLHRAPTAPGAIS